MYGNNVGSHWQKVPSPLTNAMNIPENPANNQQYNADDKGNPASYLPGE
jgi:hypothetical protein